MKIYSLFFLLLSIPVQSNGQITSVASGNWDTVTTWLGGIIPGMGDSVIINGHTITLDISPTVEDLTMLNGTLAGNESLTVTSTFVWHAGSINGAGTMTVEGPSMLISSNTKNITKTLILEGGGSWTAGTLNIHSNGILRNAPGSVLTVDISSALSITNSSGGTGNFQNQGTLVKSGTAQLNLSAMMIFDNSGSVTINGGKIVCSNSGGTHTGSFSIALNSSIEFTSSNHTFNGVTTTGDGFVHVMGATLTRGETHIILNRLQLSNGTIAGTGSLDVIDLFLWQGGTISGNGVMTIAGPAEISTVSSKNLSGTLILEDGALWTAGSINIFSGGLLTNAVGSIFEVVNAMAMSLTNSSGGTGHFQNEGTLTKSGAGALNISGLVDFTNPGSVLINEGNIAFSNTGTNTHTGSFTIAGGSQLVLSSGNHTFSGVTATGTGFVHVSTATLTRGASHSNLNRLQQSGGTISGTGSLDVIDQFLWQGGTISGSGLITLEGPAEISTVSSKNLSGTLILDDGAVWTAGSINIFNGGLLTNAVGSIFEVVNAVAMSLTNSSGGIGHFENEGSLTKSGAGALNISAGIDFTNPGLVMINEGNMVFSNSGANAHTGSFIIAGGSQLVLSSGNHTFSGVTTTSTGFVHVSAATLTRGASHSILNRLQLSSGTITGTGSLDVIDQFLWQGGTISGTGMMTIEGLAEFSTAGTKSLSGTLILEDGAVWTEGAINIFNSGRLTNAVGSIFEVMNALAMSLTNSTGGTGHFENFGTFITKDAGSLTVSGMLVFNNEGTIRGIGTITNSSTFMNTGTLAPGLSPGIITMNGAQPLSVSSTLQIELQDGSGAGTGHDQLVRSGNLSLAGTITATETGTVPDALYTVIQLTSGTISGSFSSINLPAGYVLHQLATQVILAKNTLLPLTLLSFTAERTPDEKVFMRWTTTDEVVVSHFEIQRSANVMDFASIATVSALNIPGDHTYQFTDTRPPSVINYYRLKMVDIDGQSRFSPIRIVNFKGSSEIKVYPTITSDKIFIETSEETMVRLFSSAGMLLHSQHTTGFTEMDLSHLPPDIYMLCTGAAGRAMKIIKY